MQPEDLRLERYRDYLRLLARTHLGSQLKNKVDDSDIAQETLLRAYQALDSLEYRGEAELMGWLRTLLISTLTDVFRRYHRGIRDADLERSLARSSALLEAWLAGDEPSPSSQMVRQEELLQLAEALHGLPEDQRLALEYKHLQGLSLEEIGHRMGKTRASVAGLLRRGLEQLREVLEEG